MNILIKGDDIVIFPAREQDILALACAGQLAPYWETPGTPEERVTALGWLFPVQDNGTAHRVTPVLTDGVWIEPAPDAALLAADARAAVESALLSKEAADRAAVADDPTSYRLARALAYPPITELADAEVKIASGDPDMVARGITQKAAYVAACLAVKTNNPPPEGVLEQAPL